MTGKRVTSFAFPVGNSETFNDEIIEKLRQHGFDSAVTTLKGFVNPGDDAFQLKRYNIDGEDDFNAFKCKVSGVYELFPG